jgi:hypothetical protein
MGTIFLSYRRDDSAAACGRIYERLSNTFGRETVFKDVDDIPPGVNFPDYIAEQLRGCRIVLVAIGRSWLSRRLNAPDDFVRTEIEAALQAGLIVVPLLVDNNPTMPPANKLPASIRALSSQHAAQVRNDPDFDTDMHRLVRQLERLLTTRPQTYTSASDNSETAALQGQIERLLQEVSAVGEGDLRFQAEVTPDTLGVLADTFNYMVEELAKVVVRVRATASQISEATARLASRTTAVGEQAKVAEDIARNTNGDSVTQDELKRAMDRIAEIEQKTSAMMQDANRGLDYVADLAEQLRASVATFRLPERMP